ncbi:MAG: hypothetical protein U0175_34695 [Caldilineaceae bacterium]
MSQREIFQINDVTEIRVEQVEGDLEIIGWEQNQLEAECDDDAEMMFETNDRRLIIVCNDDLSLRVPKSIALNIIAAQGDVEVNNAFGPVMLGEIQGDADLNNIGALTASTVQGDLEANNVHGPVQARKVEGDTELNNVHGSCNVGRTEGDFDANNVHGSFEGRSGGDLNIVNVHGSLTAQADGDLEIENVHGSINGRAGGDANVRLNFIAGPCTIDAGGDINCRIPANADAKVRLQAGGEINTRKLESIPIFNGSKAEFSIGNGGTSIELKAGGDINLGTQAFGGNFNFDFEFGNKSGDEIAAAASEFTRNLLGQLENGLRSLTRTVDEKLSNLGTSEEIAGRVHDKVQMAMRRAEEKIAEASKEAERRARDAEKRMAEMERRQQKGRPGAYWGPPPPVPLAPKPPRAAPQASEEERLMVLRMVSEGKISVEQAEQLLAALNG